MPIYEYMCMKCNKEFECIVIGSDDRSVSCPECNGENVKRQMSACSFKSGGNYSPPSGSSGCSSCTSSNCSTCH